MSSDVPAYTYHQEQKLLWQCFMKLLQPTLMFSAQGLNVGSEHVHARQDFSSADAITDYLTAGQTKHSFLFFFLLVSYMRREKREKNITFIAMSK